VFNASPEVAVLGSRARPCGEHGWALVQFDVEVLRVQAYPDGGIARVGAFGRATADGAAQLESMWQASA
jgi:allantoicase